jgi:hypothetical protein
MTQRNSAEITMCTMLEHRMATGVHRWLFTAALLMTGLAALPPSAVAQTWVPRDSTGDVFVNRRELRVMFPPESTAAWKWPANPDVNDAPTFFWDAAFHGIDGRLRVSVTLHARDSVRTAPSLESVVRAAKVEQCHLSPLGRCSERGVKADVEGRRVTVTLQDSALIARLFALRPDSVPIVTHMPRYLGDTKRSFARVHYVEPRLPALDSAGYAKAVANQREYDSRVLALSRSLSGGNDNALLWLAVGDSAELGIEEWQCRGDLCGHYYGYLGAPQNWGKWSVADPRIARLHRSTANHGDFRFAGQRDQVKTIVALRPGRTKVRTVGVHTLADSVASTDPLDSLMEREVIVTRPIGRLRISPRPATMVAGGSAWFRVDALDRRGRRVQGAPVDFRWGVTGGYSVNVAPNPVRVRFDEPGLYHLVAALGNHADTVNIDVRPRLRAR